MPVAPRTSPRKAPTQARSQVTVDAILAATARVLSRDGYDHLSTNRVAVDAGVSIGSLYQYFPNKESLVAALLDRHRDDMMRVLFAGLSEVESEPVAIAARRIVSAMVEVHAADPKLHRILAEQVPRVGRLRNLMEDIEVHAAVAVRAYLEAHRDELRVTDLDAAVFVVANAVEAITHRSVVSQGSLAAQQLIDATTDLVVRYLAK